MKIKESIKEITVGQTNLAKALNLSVRRVQQLVQEKVVVRDDSDPTGSVFLFDSLRNYYSSKAARDNETALTNDYMTEKTLHEKAKRELAELKLARARNQVYKASDVDQAFAEILITTRNNLLAIPSRLSKNLVGKNEDEIAAALRDELNFVLENLSNQQFNFEETEDEI